MNKQDKKSLIRAIIIFVIIIAFVSFAAYNK